MASETGILKKIIGLILLLPFVLGCHRNTIPWESTKGLVWSDEFNYSGKPDSTKWAYDIGGHGWGNDELQYYTDRLDNSRVENGKLIIELRKEDFKGRNYTSARLVTKGKASWKYGRVSVRAKLPRGLGTWPAIWMLATNQTYGDDYWPHNGEIDIMEHVGYNPGQVHASLHSKAFNHMIGTQKTAITKQADVMDAFHVYTADWTPEKIDIYLDDRLYFTATNDHGGWEHWPFDQPFHLLLNIAFGGGWGGQKGVDPNVLPQHMEVDWVRVWQ